MSVGSRIPGFYRHPVEERLRFLLERGFLTPEDHAALLEGRTLLTPQAADLLIENVIGVLGLPLAVGLNLQVNGRDVLVPMAVEEPSIVAAVSAAAKTVREGGGFRCRASDPVLIGQVQVVDVEDAALAREAVLQARAEILDVANSLHPNMVARGGGARDVEVFVHPATPVSPGMLVVHLLVDTRDAMGANLVNTMCEGVAPLVERLTGGRVFLRILSNLADRAMVKAECVVPLEALPSPEHSGEDVRDAVILANQFAAVDPYRAATHNKGILNGVDAVAVATGNDWRAIEASAHAYASLRGRYTSLTRWWRTPDGDLAGALEMPLKVGIVGGQVQANPAYAVALRILGVRSARELAEVMAAVGLAQNFGALRALSTEGIQRGHMALHARSVAVAAGAPPSLFEEVVQRLVEEGEVKVWRAREILEEVRAAAGAAEGEEGGAEAERPGVGYGKLILLGEHAVVYGRHALAVPVPLAMRAWADEAAEGIQLLVPEWNLEETMDREGRPRHSLHESLQLILGKLGIDRPVSIRVRAGVPRAMGLGGSAALAVAIIRALDHRFALGLTDEDVNQLAFQAEQIAHGRASGIDNSVATWGRPILYRPGEPPEIRPVRVGRALHLVVGLTGREGLTAAMVARVARGREDGWSAYERIFEEIETLTLHAWDALERGDLEELGRCMNLGHGLLNALQVSSHDLERLVEIAREQGALGAKLTGAGGGGAMVALAPEEPQRIVRAMRAAGYRAFVVDLDAAADAAPEAPPGAAPLEPPGGRFEAPSDGRFEAPSDGTFEAPSEADPGGEHA